MKFLLRCLIVLAVAVAFGVILYYAVQALPGATNPPVVQRPPENGQAPPQNSPARPERPESSRGNGISLRSILGFGSKMILFSAIVAIAVFTKNLIFERKPNKRTTKD